MDQPVMIEETPQEETIPETDTSLADSSYQALIAAAQARGIQVNGEKLRQAHPYGPEGITGKDLVVIARDVGLNAKRKKLRWRDLAKLHKLFPVILKLRSGHALLLEAFVSDSTSGQVAIIRDPMAGLNATAPVDEARLLQLWDGETILVESPFELDDDRRPFDVAWIARQIFAEKKLARDLTISALVSAMLALAPPFIAMIVIDRVFVSQSIPTLTALAGIVILVTILDTTLGNLRRRFTNVLVARLDGKINLFIMDRMLRLPMDFFERTPTGEISGRITQIYRVRNFLAGKLFGSMIDMLGLFVFLPVLILLDWRLTIWILSLTFCVFLIVYSFYDLIGKHIGRLVRAEISRGIFFIESLRGIRAIKSLALEGARRYEWDRRVALTVIEQYELGRVTNYPTTLSVPFERMTYSGTFIFGAFLALAWPNTLLPGTLFAFTMLASRASAPLFEIARLMQDLGEIRGAIGQVGLVTNRPPEDTREDTGLRRPIHGNVTFRNLNFRYTPDAPLALKDVSFEIPSGTIFGLMGRSGSGKTTVTRLLQGLNPEYQGDIIVDGMSLREIDLMHLRRNIGVVPQENFLFTATIRENIGIARPDATFPEIVRAAQLAGAEEFIERLPRGYDTLLEEGASNLSGGQRQRIAIARALVNDPAVLILDEATSALDPDSEAIINANLARIARDRTIICVSHRLSMLVPADAILVMEQGRVYDIGPHEDLMRRCDIYKHMWHQQNQRSESREPAHAPLALPRSASA